MRKPCRGGSPREVFHVTRQRAMLTFRFGMVLTLLNVPLVGCAGRVAVQAEQDPVVTFDAYRTYEWAPRTRAIQDVRVTPALRAIIREDIDRYLTEKGYLRVNRDGDFSVIYQVTIEGETIVQTLDGYVGSIWTDGLARRGPASLRRYEEGTLIIDVVDGESGRLIWRGSAIGEVRRRVSPEDRATRLADVVRDVMRRFPSR